MAGVIDKNGVQWERCTNCGSSVRIANLGYEQPSKNFKFGRDLCIDCVNRLPQYRMRKIKPAFEWVQQRS